METMKCYRFVKDDLTSENGEMSWGIGVWKKVSGKIVCCSNGLHAALTPRDSLRNVYGTRWFVSEARGEMVRQDNKFSASEMRIVQEIPAILLQRFAIWCAKDCLKFFEDKYPKDKVISDCIQAAEDYLEGKIKADELSKKQGAASAAIAAAIAAGPAAGRAVAAAVAAAISMVAPNAAAWVNAAAAAAHAAHAAAAAITAAIATVDALSAAANVATTARAAAGAEATAALARTAAAAGATAHAAAVAAARNVAPADTAADPYYSAYAAYSACATDAYYLAQNEKLLEMMGQNLAGTTPL